MQTVIFAFLGLVAFVLAIIAVSMIWAVITLRRNEEDRDIREILDREYQKQRTLEEARQVLNDNKGD